MSISLSARQRLTGLWGAYEHKIIKDKHFATASDLAERFLEYQIDLWRKSENQLDIELRQNEYEVREIINAWAEKKFARRSEDSLTVTTAHIMFKYLYYGKDDRKIRFGSTGANWNSREEISRELQLYRPWSIDHVIAVIGKPNLYDHMISIIEKSKSPTESRFFENWRKLSADKDRPMLFPQVGGHSNGIFYQELPNDKLVQIHFDFGIVNVVKKMKVLIECDSKSYHSKDDAYQADRDRQNLAVLKYGWDICRFTYEDVMERWKQKCVPTLEEVLFY